jgi:hypothetical protein
MALLFKHWAHLEINERSINQKTFSFSFAEGETGFWERQQNWSFVSSWVFREEKKQNSKWNLLGGRRKIKKRAGISRVERVDKFFSMNVTRLVSFFQSSPFVCSGFLDVHQIHLSSSQSIRIEQLYRVLSIETQTNLVKHDASPPIIRVLSSLSIMLFPFFKYAIIHLAAVI